MSTTSKFVYAAVFQIGWFVCIMAGNIAAFVYTSIFLIFHFVCVMHRHASISIDKEILWVAIIFGLGVSLELVSFSSNLLISTAREAHSLEPFLPPLWLMCIWIMFALALRTCLAFLFKKPVVSYLSILIFVPVNYYAGAELNEDVALAEPHSLALTLITFMWLIFFWCTEHLKRKYFEDLFNAV